MSTLVIRRILIIALFVLLSATLFALLLPLVGRAMIAYLQYRVHAEEFLLTLWATATIALSITLTAAAFLLVGYVARYLKTHRA